MHKLTVVSSFGKPDDPGHFREQGVIPTDPNILAGMETGTPLPHDNAAGHNVLSAKGFNSKHFRLRVPSILG